MARTDIVASVNRQQIHMKRLSNLRQQREDERVAEAQRQ
jgi:hypothetical protein